MRNLSQKEIKANIELFKDGTENGKDDGRKPDARYASFDYCFNYFHSFKNKRDIASKENMEVSCLHLAFYLASWGMLRGSSFLLQKSIRFYAPLIEYISKQPEDFWKIDVNNYDESSIEKLAQCGKGIEEKLSEGGINKVSDIQITKIMLGVFGNVPAYDTYFKKGSGLGTFNKDSLERIKKFYDKNQPLIDGGKIKTLEYATGEKGKHDYTDAKIIDMIYFIEGYKTALDGKK